MFQHGDIQRLYQGHGGFIRKEQHECLDGSDFAVAAPATLENSTDTLVGYGVKRR
jgi:hypothetical protein